MAVVKTPKLFTHNSVGDFLEQAQIIFSKVNRRERGFVLDFSRTKEVSILGLLLVYKVMDFTFQNRCFSDPILINADIGEFGSAQDYYKFRHLIDALRGPKEERGKIHSMLYRDPLKLAYDNMDIYFGKPNDSNRFFIAPQVMIRDVEKTKDSLRTEYAPAVVDFYKNPEISDMILTCITEISLNFWLHALEDKQSILVAEGTESKIEIACADTGSGILSTLKSGLQRLRSAPDLEIIREAVKENVSSKVNTNHLGSGLFIVDKIAQLTGGILHIYSEGVFYQRLPGRVMVGKCGFWKGTILYLNLPLNRSFGMNEIFQHKQVELSKIGLKFV